MGDSYPFVSNQWVRTLVYCVGGPVDVRRLGELNSPRVNPNLSRSLRRVFSFLPQLINLEMCSCFFHLNGNFYVSYNRPAHEPLHFDIPKVKMTLLFYQSVSVSVYVGNFSLFVQL